METNDVLKNNEQKFLRSRLLVKVTLGILLLLMIILQYDHIIALLKKI